MNLAVVEDEIIYADRVREYCGQFAQENQVNLEISCFESGIEFLAGFEKGRYSMVFMDIYMEGMSGIETARRLREQDRECILLFLTSSTDFMPEAFSCHAFEYIVKPFAKERIFQVLEDALKIMPPASTPVYISSQRRTVPVLPGDIMAAVSDGHYLDIRLQDGSVLRSRMTVSELLKLVDGDPCFFCVNKGIIVNADYIRTIENQCCTLEDGSSFPIRVRDSLKIERSLQEYNFAKLRSQQRYRR